jgi:hypothetical protein
VKKQSVILDDIFSWPEGVVTRLADKVSKIRSEILADKDYGFLPSFLRAWHLLAFLLVLFGCGDSSPELPLAGLKVEFGQHNIRAEMLAGETVLADVTTKNASSRTWPSKPNQEGRNAVNLSYHWLDRKRQVVVYDGLRTPLPRDLNPGESVTLRATIRAPEKAGEYLLHVTLVQEGVAWFSDSDGGHILVPVSVKP